MDFSTAAGFPRGKNQISYRNKFKKFNTQKKCVCVCVRVCVCMCLYYNARVRVLKINVIFTFVQRLETTREQFLAPAPTINVSMIVRLLLNDLFIQSPLECNARYVLYVYIVRPANSPLVHGRFSPSLQSCQCMSINFYTVLRRLLLFFNFLFISQRSDLFLGGC